eukprot:Gregarina_sp_Poly_1__4841@NODE_257_length_10511_cov_261_924071_g224_i0_p1_GENE_NODE_257_length_10511_cov_261_924071_g224_i0NODE_257_length_10511_cov_261_924071_g224_i0_p1_ORF_typecomplete_len1435_score276_78BLM10_mid/PF16507_5/0_048BLM10_mid/PF16507_5/5_1e03_NODE_257_length_10511_cov_261_924071_g224_i028767180
MSGVKRRVGSLERVCGKLQMAVEEALESPTKLSRLNGHSRTIVREEGRQLVNEWLADGDAGIGLETWWYSVAGESLQKGGPPGVALLTAFLSLLEFLDNCIRSCNCLLPAEVARFLLHTSAAQVIQFLQHNGAADAAVACPTDGPPSSKETASREDSSVLRTLCLLCLTRINGLCSTQHAETASTSVTGRDARRYSIAPLSEYLVTQLFRLFQDRQHALCLAILTSFEQSLHRAVCFDAPWRAGFKPALRQLASLALRISLDGDCQTQHPQLAEAARRTVAFLTWKAVKAQTSENSEQSSFEWAMESTVASCNSHVQALSSLFARFGISESQTLLTDDNRVDRVDRAAVTISGIVAGFRTLSGLLEWGGNCNSSASSGEEAFGNVRFHPLECGVSILRVDTTVLWPMLTKCVQQCVDLIERRVEFHLTFHQLQTFLQEYCSVLKILIRSFPSSKIAIFSGFLRQILSTLLVNFNSAVSGIRVLCLSRGSIADMLDAIVRHCPSLLLSRMVSSVVIPDIKGGVSSSGTSLNTANLSTGGLSRQSEVIVTVCQQLNHSVFSMLKKLRVDFVNAQIRYNSVTAVKELRCFTGNGNSSSHPLMDSEVISDLTSCVIELFRIATLNKRHITHFGSALKPSLAEEELEILWFLFRGLEAVENTKGSALAYKNMSVLFSSKFSSQTSLPDKTVQLGSTLAWLNLIHHILLDNRGEGLEALFHMTQTLIVPPVSIVKLPKKPSPFQAAIGALLGHWRREITEGHLRTTVSDSCVDFLGTLVTNVEMLMVSDSSPGGESPPLIIRRATSSFADSLTALSEELRDAWDSILGPARPSPPVTSSNSLGTHSSEDLSNSLLDAGHRDVDMADQPSSYSSSVFNSSPAETDSETEISNLFRPEKGQKSLQAVLTLEGEESSSSQSHTISPVVSPSAELDGDAYMTSGEDIEMPSSSSYTDAAKQPCQMHPLAPETSVSEETVPHEAQPEEAIDESAAMEDTHESQAEAPSSALSDECCVVPSLEESQAQSTSQQEAKVNEASETGETIDSKESTKVTEMPELGSNIQICETQRIVSSLQRSSESQVTDKLEDRCEPTKVIEIGSMPLMNGAPILIEKSLEDAMAISTQVAEARPEQEALESNMIDNPTESIISMENADDSEASVADDCVVIDIGTPVASEKSDLSFTNTNTEAKEFLAVDGAKAVLREEPLTVVEAIGNNDTVNEAALEIEEIETNESEHFKEGEVFEESQIPEAPIEPVKPTELSDMSDAPATNEATVNASSETPKSKGAFESTNKPCSPAVRREVFEIPEKSEATEALEEATNNPMNRIDQTIEESTQNISHAETVPNSHADDCIVIDLGTPVLPLDDELCELDHIEDEDLVLPRQFVDSPHSFDSGPSSPSGFDSSLLEDRNEEYLTCLARSHDISDDDDEEDLASGGGTGNVS